MSVTTKGHCIDYVRSAQSPKASFVREEVDDGHANVNSTAVLFVKEDCDDPIDVKWLRVATVNLNRLFDAKAKARALQEHGPFDLLALQEASKGKALLAFAGELGMRVAVSRLADYGLYNVLLVSQSLRVCRTWSWDLDCGGENRAAVALQIGNSIFVCTHLDAYKEDKRVRQLCLLRSYLAESCHCESMPVFLLGDFNALRQEDYSLSEWEELRRSRAIVNIKSETEVTEKIASWGWIDCRSVSCCNEGPTSTHRYGARVDYMWANYSALSWWTVKKCLHNSLPLTITDHSLIVYEIESNERNAMHDNS